MARWQKPIKEGRLDWWLGRRQDGVTAAGSVDGVALELGKPHCFIPGERDGGPVRVVAKQSERRSRILDSGIVCLFSWPLPALVSALLCHLG